MKDNKSLNYVKFKFKTSLIVLLINHQKNRKCQIIMALKKMQKID